MGLLGFLLQLGTALYVMYLGYNFEINYVYLLVAPLGFLFGHMVRKSNHSLSYWAGKGGGVLSGIIKSYLTGLVLTAIFFGLGYGIMHVMMFEPAEGVGRY